MYTCQLSVNNVVYNNIIIIVETYSRTHYIVVFLTSIKLIETIYYKIIASSFTRKTCYEGDLILHFN